MKLSIVILNYNAAAFLELCIYSVLQATKNIDAEIIVADNNSTDSSLQMLEDIYGDQIKVIAHKENYGFSKGNNLAVEQAQGEFLCILNPDTIVGEEVFEDCLAFAQAQSKMGFLGVQLIDGTGKYLPESKRHIPTPKVARHKMLGNDCKYYFHEVGQNERGNVDILVGAFMFCHKEVYEDCGGFDERYFMYGEDIDLSYTAILKGYENYYLGDQKVIHFKGESTIKDKVYLERFYGAMGLFYDKYFKQSALEKTVIDLIIKGMVAVKSNPTKNREVKELDFLYLVTEDKSLDLPIKMEKVKHSEVWDCPFVDSTFLWDMKTLTIQEIIEFMIQTKELKHRFLSPKRDFYIGSDSSNSRGEIKYM